MDMRLNQITKKLVKNNIKQYLILIGSIIFAVSMIAAYGIIQFSPTVDDILMDGGSTQMISLGTYGLNMIGSLIFIIYAHGLFLKHKSKEIGVFMSLGIRRKNVQKMVMKELRFIVPLATFAGLLFSIPISFFCWSFITMFLSTAETNYSIGFLGLIIAFIFSMVAMMIIHIKTIRYIKNADIIKILKSTEEVEDLKGDHYILGVIGFILIPVGLFLFRVFSISEGFLGKIHIIFLGLSLIGLYLFIIQITSIGTFIKNINKKYYYKNIVFFNLIKQKGKQYTLALFVSTILMSISIFALGFNAIGMIDGLNKYEKIDPFDVAVIIGFQQGDLKIEDILSLAKEHDIKVKDLVEMNEIMLGYNIAEYNEWNSNPFISEEFVRKITGKKDFDLEPGTFVTLISVDPSYIRKDKKNKKNIERILLDSTTREEMTIVDNGKVYIGGVLNHDSFHNGKVNVLDSNDYNRLRENQKDEFVVKTYMFNADDWTKTEKFSKDLYELVAKKSGYQWCSNFKDAPIFDRVLENGYGGYDHYDMKDYKGSELYANKRWVFSPYTRYHAYYNSIQDYAIYLLLMVFISIVAFSSAVMVVGIKILNTMWQDKILYKNLTFLGYKLRDIRFVVTKQAAIIYFVPTLLGSILTILLLGEMLKVMDVYFPNEVLKAVGFITLFMWTIQVFIFFFVRKAAIKECTNFENV
ncbi:FtsX-like permease family protein [Inediibacterium massiliense]|uniref:FtsX-like permease family protein n=1 Tax=Inediibacterium massiliense TaxID=1658111 RepID=UPI0006B64324|nr:ABC transporter permease [Inediibacterium massiliense]